MAAPNRNYELNKSHLYIEIPFIWLNNYNNLLSAEMLVLISSIKFLFNFSAQVNGTTPFPSPQLRHGL
jgi:hypothetical protein